MPDLIEDWKIEVMTLLGLKETRIESTPNQGTGAMIRAQVRDPSTVLPNVVMPGKTAPTGRVGKYMAKELFGSSENRHKIDPKNQDRLMEMQNRGESTPVRLNANGRALQGNFVTAKGHNLKEKDFKPDLSRPVVLLLTGSGGSAEDQGLDVASMYSEGGASVLSVNYGGYGSSPDCEVSEQSLNQDAQAMLEHLVALGYDPDKIVIHGYSLGGAVAGQLAGAYEQQGVRFRGLVQDRPMTSTYDGVMGHMNNPKGMLGGLVAEKTVGEMSGKSGMLDTDTSTRKVVTTDEGEFANRGDKLRRKLEQQGHDVSGERTNKGHFEHGEMIQKNQDPLLELVRVGRDGKKITEPLDMDVVFRETVATIMERIKSIHPGIVKAREDGDVEAFTTVMRTIQEAEDALRELDRTGVRKCKRFEAEFMKLDLCAKQFNKHRDVIQEEVRKLGAGNPFAAEELVRLSSVAAVMRLKYDELGGAKPENRLFEDEILGMYVKFGDLLEELGDQETLRREHPEVFTTYDDLDEMIGEIVAARLHHEQEIDYAANEIASIPKRPDLATEARDAVYKELKRDLEKLNPEKEDVSADRLIGKSADKGFKKLVVDPVDTIVQMIQDNIRAENPRQVNADTMPQVIAVQRGLQGALNVYSEKLRKTDQRKHPKDYEQRKKKVDAIQSRIDGLAGLIDKCNKFAQKVEEKFRAHEDESLDQLATSGMVDKARDVIDSLRGDGRADTGDPERDKKTHERAAANTKSAATFFDHLDPIQREAMGRLKLEPNGLAKTLAKMGMGSTDVVEGVMRQCAEDGDDEYLYTLLDAAVEDEFANTGEGTKALRSNSAAAKLTTLIAERGEGKAFCDRFRDEVTDELKGKKLEVRPPNAPPPNASTKVKQAYQAEVQACQRAVDEHVKLFRKVVQNVLSRRVPSDIAKVAATIYNESMKKSGDEEESLAYVGGLLVLRLLSPTILKFDFGQDVDAQRASIIQNKLLQNLASGTKFKEDFMKPFDGLIAELSDQMQTYFKSIVAEGNLERDGVDVADLADEALGSRKIVDSLFLAPSREDPFGTLPANRSTPLGRAIDRLRLQRNRDYDWDGMAKKLQTDPRFYDDDNYTERCEVLELVRDER